MSMRRFTAADLEAHLDTGHIPVTQGLAMAWAMGLAPAPSLLLHALVVVRECRDMSPTLESRVSGPLGRHVVLVWAGYGRRPEFQLSCYVVLIVMLCHFYARGVGEAEGPPQCPEPYFPQSPF